jgi:hypothetical protein
MRVKTLTPRKCCLIGPLSALVFPLFLTGVLAGAAFAQAQTDSTAFPIGDDEIAMTFAKISERAARLEPMLGQLHPADWVTKGAADAYIAQWNTTLSQFRAVQADMAGLSQHPGHISDTMKSLFRLQSIHPMLDSLMGGTRKYQNPALADLIESVSSENTADIEKVERYLVQITNDQEQQFAVMDHEAQRCRATLSRQPAPAARNGTRKSQ